jgi:hypothetical protein
MVALAEDSDNDLNQSTSQWHLAIIAPEDCWFVSIESRLVPLDELAHDNEPHKLQLGQDSASFLP